MSGRTCRATSADLPNGRPLGRQGETGAHGGTQAALFARLAEVHAEAAQIYQDLAEAQLDAHRDRALMDGVAVSAESAPAPGRLLTAHDVAERLRVNAKTIRRWRESGRLPPAIELGGIVRWRARDIDAWLEEQVR